MAINCLCVPTDTMRQAQHLARLNGWVGGYPLIDDFMQQVLVYTSWRDSDTSPIGHHIPDGKAFADALDGVMDDILGDDAGSGKSDNPLEYFSGRMKRQLSKLVKFFRQEGMFAIVTDSGNEVSS